jgi:N-acetylglucosaminyldiphosphoundecaprenol N-acetyl-beta-D-mannosaminyltransferase
MQIILGIRFSSLSFDAILEDVISSEIPPEAPVRLMVTANIDHVVHLRRDAAFAQAYADAWIATADGMPVYLYARWRGAAVPARVTGADFFAAMMRRLLPERHRPFFVASTHETADRLRTALKGAGFSPETIGFDVPPQGFDQDTTYSDVLARRIRDHGTTHLVFGVGSPKSEIWIDAHKGEIGSCYAFAFGAGLDFFAGVQRRAPIWMRKTGFEWFWRLIHNPRRLFRRYVFHSWRFIWAMKDDLSGAA